MDDIGYEISYRDSLKKKAYMGQKLSPQDKLWLITHPTYNQRFAPAALMSDIINLTPNVYYNIDVTIEKNNTNSFACPIIAAPDKCGKLSTNACLHDYSGKHNSRNSVYMICFDWLIENQKKATVKFRSKTGVLSIDYRFDFYDEKQGIMMRKSSRSGDLRFAMRKQFIGANKLQYRCLFPGMESFNSLFDFVFTIEWNEDVGDL